MILLEPRPGVANGNTMDGEESRWKLSDLAAQYAGARRWRAPGKFLDNGCRATWEQFASPWRFRATVRNIPKLNGKRLFGTRPRTCMYAAESGARFPRVTPKTPAGIPEFAGEIPFPVSRAARPALVRLSPRKTLLSFVRASRYGTMLTYSEEESSGPSSRTRQNGRRRPSACVFHFPRDSCQRGGGM